MVSKRFLKILLAQMFCSGLFYASDADSEAQHRKALVKLKKKKSRNQLLWRRKTFSSSLSSTLSAFFTVETFQLLRASFGRWAWQDHHRHQVSLCPKTKRCHLGPGSHSSCWEQATSQFGCWGVMTNHHPLQRAPNWVSWLISRLSSHWTKNQQQAEGRDFALLS